MGDATKTDEFSEKFQTSCDPTPSYINLRSDHGVTEVDIELVELLCNRGAKIGDK